MARMKYILPTPDEFIRMINSNIIRNLREGHEAKVVVPPLVERAYILVNTTGVLPVMDYPVEQTLKVRQ